MPLFVRNISKMIGSFQIIKLYSTKEIGFVKNIAGTDILLQNLRNAPTTKKLLDLMSSHSSIMNHNHVMQTFRSLFVLKKSGDKSVSTNEILNNEHFKSVCVSLKKQIRGIEINDLLEMLKILSFIGVPTNSKIAQIILQMIRQEVNNLNLQHIIFLDFLLKQFEETPLREALLIALPIVFEVQLNMKIDRENINQLTDLLQYSAKNQLMGSVDIILNSIAAHQFINPKQATSIVWSICELKQHENYAPILRRMLQIITKHSKELTFSDLESTLTRIIFKYNKKYTFYFDEKFFNAVAENLIENKLNYLQSVWILKKFSKVGYNHNGLLDYLSTFCHEDLNIISNTNSWNLYNLVTGFANADYKPIYWESVKQAILENKNVFDGKKVFNWIKFATRLAILDIYRPDVLQYALKSNQIDQYFQNEKQTHSTAENFLILYQTLSTIRSEYSNLLPDISYIKKAMNYVYLKPLENNSRPLKATLERGFGGASYVLTNVATKLGHLIHHLVVLRKGGFPVAFNPAELKYPLLLEDLEIPPESYKVAVFGCDASFYKVRTSTFRTIYPLMFETIESTFCSVVPINVEVWNCLADYEKIPYLMQKVREKHEEVEKLVVENQL